MRHLCLHLASVVVALAATTLACSSEGGDPSLVEGTDVPAEGEDLPIGDLGDADMKADGVWGHATECKDLPDYPKLVQPRIIVSIDGLSLHLIDDVTGYDKVFPVGVGSMNHNEGETSYGESLSYFPLLHTNSQEFEIHPGGTTPCKIWWHDSSTGRRLPVFAGLPFLSWWGNYGIHGPIDNYRAENGGNLRRGYVSHGCIRMEAEHILELFVRIRGITTVPVHVQREPERDVDGRRVDVPDTWFGAECEVDEDCAYEGGLCKINGYGGRGFCTMRCDQYCPDKSGYPVSYCVQDPDEPDEGMCVFKESPLNDGCRPLDHFTPREETRHNQPSFQARVCLPGSRGWIGDRCWFPEDCLDGTFCTGATEFQAGQCTEECSWYCPDQPGWPTTFCVDEPTLGGLSCVRQCTPASNASECPAGTACVERPRAGTGPVRTVCLPQ